MLVSFIRTITIYVLLMLAMRLMGKRQLGDLQPGELIITIIISDLAAIPITNTGVPLIQGLIPLITLVICELTVSAISLRSTGFRRRALGSPIVVIDNGTVVQKNLIRLRFTLDDLLGEVRNCSCASFADVAFAIVETDGKFSVIAADPSAPPPETLPRMVVSDGKIDKNELAAAGLDERSVRDAIDRKQLALRNVFYCFYLGGGKYDIVGRCAK
ncbi:MAG: DUF421 domain-containing protein [Clostridia bacterium]|nr:DUF421 domain-containing protein [Clostridia bacterium]